MYTVIELSTGTIIDTYKWEYEAKASAGYLNRLAGKELYAVGYGDI